MEEFDKNPKRPMMYAETESQLSRGILSCCKGYCGRAGRGAECGAERGTSRGSKDIRLLCNSTLITDIPSRGSKEERIRIHLQVWANIQNNGYNR